jgi:hypothetical protein
MRFLATIALGFGMACAIFGAGIVVLFKRGAWELEKFDREDRRYAE